MRKRNKTKIESLTNSTQKQLRLLFCLPLLLRLRKQSKHININKVESIYFLRALAQSCVLHKRVAQAHACASVCVCLLHQLKARLKAHAKRARLTGDSSLRVFKRNQREK